MKQRFIKILSFAVLLSSNFNAQTFNNLFRTKDRPDNLEDFDLQKFSWGFFLAGNNFDYKMVLNPTYGMDGNQSLVESKSTYSFGAGLIGKMRLNEFLDLRIEPGLHFVQRDLTFKTFDHINELYPGGFPLPDGSSTTVITEPTDVDIKKIVKSTYVDIPIMLEIHGDRWYNSRPYAAAGINYLVNLQSNQTSENDNQLNTFRSTTHNFGWSAELGIQFYFNRFKLTPAIRGTFFTNNEIVQDKSTTSPYWTPAISMLQSRAFMFVLKFE
ncbi:porin family protein [Epilithonimonas pallida]|uniref:Probable protein-translocating porin PorT n=1 Tax=Epilithonimonas pallida TaxID=373671 RepID=A0ABY1R2Y5_9FLAO|nr:porin family protein [Epilithonimonas pallida]SMP93269.1 probable protein-translocating porin PorT [Epilithonimonas pallida]